jgi:looped-hinge helix DNA binding domain, AbrB family
MRSIGVVRKLDKMGRIVLPTELRKEFKINHNDELDIYVEGSTVILTKHEIKCIFCGKSNNIICCKGKPVCSKCLSDVWS